MNTPRPPHFPCNCRSHVLGDRPCTGADSLHGNFYCRLLREAFEAGATGSGATCARAAAHFFDWEADRREARDATAAEVVTG